MEQIMANYGRLRWMIEYYGGWLLVKRLSVKENVKIQGKNEIILVAEDRVVEEDIIK